MTIQAESSVGPALLDEARRLLPGVIELRRELHRHPEVGLELPDTQARLIRALEGLPLEVRTGETIGSVVATLEGGRPGPTVLLRADMDGLPLQEDTGLEFASVIAGAMHACGHDTHVAMLIGAARLLAARRGELAGRVLFMFQPGEEGYHGARVMLDEGLLDEEAPPTGAFAIHIGTRYRSGTVNLRRGPLLASGDTIRITVRGSGGHASAPHHAVDPIAVAAEITLALQAMVTRRIDIFDPAVLTIANITAGTTTNIIPETAFLQGTMRTLSAATREAMRANVRRVAEGIAAAHGATAEVELEPGYPVTVNDAAFADHVMAVATELIGPDDVAEMPDPIMGAEDFSYVLERVPGAMAFLGACPAEHEPGEGPQGHSNRVVFDEDAMAVGVALYAAVALAEAGRASA
ncbi:MAG TPA: M20 family metallopeptidase [Candidatus Angelobacter sp.]|nr:M20 family metallopeptidase [Candidatus Angelobacter sp.]